MQKPNRTLLIDTNDIIQTVVDLLEGGDEAFERREQRYKDRV